MIGGKNFQMALEEGWLKNCCPEKPADIRDRSRTVTLLQTASRVRDRIFGQEIHCMATVSPILPCKIEPHCLYCGTWRMPVLDQDAIVEGIKIMERRGIRRVLMEGGACRYGYDREILDIVRAVKKQTMVDLEVNIGASLSRETVKRLRDIGVAGITVSLETVNKEVFMQAKPGDRFESRKRLLETCDGEGFKVRSAMMVGCGESEEDRIQHLLYLREIINLRYLMISRFTPQLKTPWSKYPACSSLDWARTIALARLILPRVCIVMGGEAKIEDLPLWYLAGGGGQIFGMEMMPNGSSKKHSSEAAIPVNETVSVVDQLPVLEPFLTGLGCRISFEDRLPDDVVENTGGRRIGEQAN